MKKTIKLLFTLACLWIANANAQEQGNIEFGVVGGVNISGITDSYFTSSERTSFNAGIFGDYYFSDRWSMKAKITYDQKGWKSGYFIINGTTIGTQTTSKFNYVTVPIMANWHFGKKRNWFLNFGPYVGILGSASEGGINIKSEMNSVDAGIALGIGVKIPLSERCKLLLEYEGQGGMTNIYKGSDGSSIKNIRVGFNAGVCFPLK